MLPTSLSTTTEIGNGEVPVSLPRQDSNGGIFGCAWTGRGEAMGRLPGGLPFTHTVVLATGK
eukprot:1772375-Pyramimonas_sp.AAC.1